MPWSESRRTLRRREAALKAENYAHAALRTGIKGYGERDRLRGLAKREAAVTELT